ncbi:hypothetical protein PAXRUDRAFT_233282 [Paxillus rubicundulus Ve08.2h10]|uniref:Uncharacterized protein n=1 Tax=Paxillus rubicundulus Ve08.2h10 TaxID=930991 RepID=A0A0D0DGT0_9AGAM|nr:hypothetical protein PAXRUDRAFT_233282 [Paxillus rubicundulus Ve08.2h10]
MPPPLQRCNPLQSRCSHPARCEATRPCVGSRRRITVDTGRINSPLTELPAAPVF